MWPDSIDIENIDVVLDQRIIQANPKFEPTPYTFTKIENGKKNEVLMIFEIGPQHYSFLNFETKSNSDIIISTGHFTNLSVGSPPAVGSHRRFVVFPVFPPTALRQKTADTTSLILPSWLLLDHTIAVVWSMFNSKQTLSPLSIDDLKWAYEFLKEIKNKKGENPPDVKVCLKEIQDRLINLYAKLTFREEYFDEIAAAFGEKFLEDSNANYFNNSSTEKKLDSKAALSPSKTRMAVVQRQSLHDIGAENGKNKRKKSDETDINYSKTALQDTLSKEPDDVFEDVEDNDDQVEKYVLSLFEGNKKEEPLQSKPSTKSLIPTKRLSPSPAKEVHSTQNASCDLMKKEKTSKRVHCYAEMRSLKFQKSMKVKDKNGEEAAYSNLKAEIQRLTINPKVSRKEVMKFLKDWRSEQVDRLHNELKRLSSIEEFMKNLSQEEVEPNNQINSKVKLKDFDEEKNYSFVKSLFQ